MLGWCRPIVPRDQWLYGLDVLHRMIARADRECQVTMRDLPYWPAVGRYARLLVEHAPSEEWADEVRSLMRWPRPSRLFTKS